MLLDYNFEKTSVLEIGAGIGFTAWIICNLHGDRVLYTGTDISNVFCENAKKLFKHNMVCTKADNMPFEDKSFNALFAFDVLEHIPFEDRVDVYKEVNRVLKDSAVIFINNPHPQNMSWHDKRYDFTFDDQDIARLCLETNMQIRQMTMYPGTKGYFYYFIALVRGILY